ncbi:MAG: phage holin family protein [Muribaculaceae bacterium]|nr:phage holin family protein [Muribaculaceae bacterium]
MTEKKSKFPSLLAELRAYIENNIEYARLTAAEKLAVLMTSAAVALVLGAVACLIFFFISMALVYWMATFMTVAMAYTIMAAFYVVAFIVIFFLRKQVLINPICKFISKIILR